MPKSSVTEATCHYAHLISHLISATLIGIETVTNHEQSIVKTILHFENSSDNVVNFLNLLRLMLIVSQCASFCK